jgi:signal transduction histidine kinase
MSTVANPTFTDRAGKDGAFGLASLRSERSIALIRIAVVSAVMAIYISSLGIRRTIGPSAMLVLTLSAVYCLSCLILMAWDRAPSYGVRLSTLLVDTLLVTVWVQATGGGASEFWTLYLIVVVSAALRFRLVETIAVSFGVTILHLSVTMADGGIARSQLIYRPTLMVATGFAVGILSYQRSVHRRERTALQALTERQTLQLGAERAEVERLRRVDMKRSEFVAIAAHEFRTPLAAILGVISTMKVHGKILDQSVRDELLDGASAQAERLARLVEDLLTVSRIEDGVLRLHPEPTQVREIISEAERAAGAAGRVVIELHRVSPLTCDADAVVRVLTNLLDNARKYSPEDSPIVVSVEQGEELVRFSVRDAGPGIAPDDREAVFERFRRLGEAGGKPGAGLGLYISRGLVEAHGGTMEIGDAPGGGAEFSFTLPRHPQVLPVEDDAPSMTSVTAAASTSL